MTSILSNLIAEGGVWFDPKVSLGSLIISLTFVGTALFHWRDVTWKIKNSQAWQADHEKEAGVQQAILSEVRDAVFQLKTLSEGQGRRITQLEDRLDRQVNFDRARNRPNERG